MCLVQILARVLSVMTDIFMVLPFYRQIIEYYFEKESDYFLLSILSILPYIVILVPFDTI